MNCKNCGHIIDGKYCSHCGQNSKVDRINLPNFLSEVSESVFQINRGFLYTLRELFIRPGKSLREFLNGKRKNHVKPIAYLLTFSTLYFLITQVTHQNTLMNDLISGYINGSTTQAQGFKVPIVLIWFSKNYAYASLLVLPVFSLASYLLFYKFRINYIEHMVVNSFISGHQAVLYSLFAIAENVIKSDIVEAVSLLGAISYTFWVFWQFFSEGSRTINILRSVMTYVLYFMICIIFLFAITWFSES